MDLKVVALSAIYTDLICVFLCTIGWTGCKTVTVPTVPFGIILE